MDFEFDKEIDILLRQTAQSETVFAKTNSKHLDSDEISAFAENALPEKARQNYLLHLADCDHCRKNLSRLIALNAETESEIIHAVKSDAPEIITSLMPWYSSFFAAPKLAFLMGALVLVFSGIGVVTILQNNSRNSEVSQISEKQTGGKGMSSDGETATQEIFSSNQMSSNTATAMSNSASNSPMSSANLPMPSAPVMTANSNSAANTRRIPNQIARDVLTDDKSSVEPAKSNSTTTTLSAGAPPPKPTENNIEIDGMVTDSEQPILSQNQSVQNQTTQNQTQIMPDSRNVQRAPMPAAKMRKQESRADELKKDTKENLLETTGVGGKNFTRVNNIWTDSIYRGQATTNVSRGTRQYKKLDSGLRGIVENLGGTVIVVWKEKAYRIQ